MSEQVPVTECSRCPRLVDCRSSIVNGVGDADAELMFVGEAPGANEDESGEPFVGRSGDVLDDELAEHGFSRQDVRITNCVRCRPPDNADPTEDEIASCRGYLDAEIVSVNPEVIVTLGRFPSEALLGETVSVTSAAGDTRSVEVGGEHYTIVVCVHPAATLYDPSQRDAFTEAFERAVELSGATGGQSTLGDF